MDLKESVIDKWTEDNRQEIEEKKDYRGKPIAKVSLNFGGLKFFECPAGWITHETNLLIQMLTFEEKPVKIIAGTWMDQPRWYIEAIQIYNTQRNKWLQAQKA